VSTRISILQQQVIWEGIWERQIRTIRKLLSQLLHEFAYRLDDEITLDCEVEAIVNSIPLKIVFSDPDAINPLKPNYLLTIKTNMVMPPPG